MAMIFDKYYLNPEVANWIKGAGYTRSRFVELAGISNGMLSLAISQKRPVGAKMMTGVRKGLRKIGRVVGMSDIFSTKKYPMEAI